MDDKFKTQYPTRKVQVHTTPNGEPFAYSMTSSKHVKVIAEVQAPPQLPGLVIFVHGVNSEGEWYDHAEKALCDGLNIRLGLIDKEEKLQLKANEYFEAHWGDDEKNKWIVPPRKIKTEGRSPVIRFYWGYRAADGEEDSYAIPLKNKRGDNFWDIEHFRNLPADQRARAGPFYWGGGPFQNGCNNLVSLWSSEGFNSLLSPLGVPLPFSTQLINGERDRLLSKAPPRRYFAHPAGRLAALIKTIRDTHPEDSVTVLSHSQGTMIALAAAAIEAPDALFVMNSPYALQNELTNWLTYPLGEIPCEEARAATFADIVNKVAENKTRLSRQKTGNLLAGAASDGENWKPDGVTTGGMAERDNHGNTYIYCNPHDRVMGSAPLRSIGWQGLPNTAQSHYAAPHPLFAQAGGTLYVRILARNTPCGGPPDAHVHFGSLEDGKPFWDSTITPLEKLTWPAPPPAQTLKINAPTVPQPVSAEEMKDFDSDYASTEKQSGEVGWGYGQINPETNRPVDADYRYYISLYGYFDQQMEAKKPSGYYQPGPGSKDERWKYEKQSRAEMLESVRTWVLRPTDHSTLPMSEKFMRRVVAYDLPIGFCWHSWDRKSLANLRHQADWLESDDYYRYGTLNIPPMPSIIRRETAPDAAAKRTEAVAQAERQNQEVRKIK